MPITKAEYEALADFRYSVRHFMRFSEQAAQALGLTPQQHQALLHIKGFSGRERVTIGELAERLQIRPHSAVGLVNRLTGLGFVSRTTATEDRRHVFVQLTNAGEKLLEQLAAAHRAELRRVGPRLRDLLDQLGR